MNKLSTPGNWYDGIAKQIDLIGEALNRRNYRKHKIETLRCLAHRIDQFSPECGQCQMFKQDISTMVQDVSSISRITTKESKKRYFGSIKSIIGHLQREHKLVTEGYYTGLGIAIGSGLGVAIGTAMDNVGSGIPIGVGVGLAIGAALDAKAKKEDRILCPSKERNISDSRRSIVIIGILIALLFAGILVFILFNRSG